MRRTVAREVPVTATKLVTVGGVTRPLDPDLFAACADTRPLIRIGDKWTTKLVVCLRDGPRRFGELLRPLRGITPT